VQGVTVNRDSGDNQPATFHRIHQLFAGRVVFYQGFNATEIIQVTATGVPAAAQFHRCDTGVRDVVQRFFKRAVVKQGGKYANLQNFTSNLGSSPRF